MTRNRWYVLKSYVRSSLWIVPFVALLLEQIALHVISAVDASADRIPTRPVSMAGKLTALQTIITLTLSFIVFTFGSLIVAIQIASGQLTPRIIATTLLRDNVIRFTVGLFLMTLLFAIGTVARIEDTVPRLVTWTTAVLGLLSMSTFLFLIDYAARLLRPVSIVWRVGEMGVTVIQSVYPDPITELDARPHGRRPAGVMDVRVAINHQGTSAIVLAVNLKALVDEARRVDGIIEVVPRVGDFVSVGEPVFMVHGAVRNIDERKLRGAVAFGPERTIEQD